MGFAFILVLAGAMVLSIKYGAAHTSRSKVLVGKHSADVAPVTERAKHVMISILHRLDAIMGIELVHCLLTAGAIFGWFGRGEH